MRIKKSSDLNLIIFLHFPSLPKPLYSYLATTQSPRSFFYFFLAHFLTRPFHELPVKSSSSNFTKFEISTRKIDLIILETIH